MYPVLPAFASKLIAVAAAAAAAVPWCLLASAHLLRRVCECHLQLLPLTGHHRVHKLVGKDGVVQFPETLLARTRRRAMQMRFLSCKENSPGLQFQRCCLWLVQTGCPCSNHPAVNASTSHTAGCGCAHSWTTAGCCSPLVLRQQLLGAPARALAALLQQLLLTRAASCCCWWWCRCGPQCCHLQHTYACKHTPSSMQEAFSVEWRMHRSVQSCDAKICMRHCCRRGRLQQPNAGNQQPKQHEALMPGWILA